MKTDKLRMLAAAACAACATVAFGEFSSVTVPEKSYANPLTLNVTSDQTLSAALAAAGASVADLTDNVYDKVVKTGDGKVTVDEAIAAFAGDLFVEAGTWCITVNDGWGVVSDPADNTSFVAIAAGATLEMGGTVSFKGLDKTIYVAGTGVDDAGAICFTSTQSSDATACGPWGRNIVLTGDATFRNGSTAEAKIGRNRLEQQVTFYLNGHKLTYRGNNESTDCYAYWATGGKVEIAAGAFALICTGGLYSKFEGDSSNEFILSGTGKLKSGADNYCNPDTAWTLVVQTAEPLTWTSSSKEGANPDYNFWPGPVRLETDATLTGKNGTSFSLKGRVSGEHSLAMTSVTADKTPHFYLASAENDFTGGLSVTDAVVHAEVNGAVPADGGALTLTRAAVSLDDPVNYTLPPVCAAGSCAVQPPAALVVNRAATPGLYEGYDDQIATKSAATGDTTTLYTDSVQLSPRWANTQTTLSETTHYGRWTYSGYLWNNTSEPVVWIFTASPRYCGVLRVGDVWVNTQSGQGSAGSSLLVSSGKRGLIRATLQPGANRIELIGMITDPNNQMKTGSIGLDSYDKTTLGFGNDDALMVYKQDITLDEAKGIPKNSGWVKLSDPGDGSVFTIDLPSDPEPQTATVPALSFGADATLELGGWNLVTTDLNGFGAIVNATATDSGSSLTVNGAWTIDGAAVRDGGKLATDRAVAFGPESTVVLSGTKSPAGGQDYVILTAEGGITGLPTCEGAKLRLSDDGKSLILCRDAQGSILIFR